MFLVMESTPEFRKIMDAARRAHGKTSAQFDYSLAFGETSGENQYESAGNAVRNAIWDVANQDQGGTEADQMARVRALRERIQPELDALTAECAAKSYTGWSKASRGPIRYAR